MDAIDHSGKDELCFAEKFAAPLYDMLYAMHDGIYMDHFFEGDKNAILPYASNQVTVRKALQTLGTEWGRDVFGDNIWSNLLCARIMQLATDFPDRHNKFSTTVVISDCRFVNEVATVREAFSNVEVWAVVRNESTPQLAHRSEQQIDQIFARADKIIDNNGSLEDLDRQVCQALAVKLNNVN